MWKKKLITDLKFEIKDVGSPWSVNHYGLNGGKKWRDKNRKKRGNGGGRLFTSSNIDPVPDEPGTPPSETTVARQKRWYAYMC